MDGETDLCFDGVEIKPTLIRLRKALAKQGYRGEVKSLLTEHSSEHAVTISERQDELPANCRVCSLLACVWRIQVFLRRDVRDRQVIADVVAAEKAWPAVNRLLSMDDPLDQVVARHVEARLSDLRTLLPQDKRTAVMLARSGGAPTKALRSELAAILVHGGYKRREVGELLDGLRSDSSRNAVAQTVRRVRTSANKAPLQRATKPGSIL